MAGDSFKKSLNWELQQRVMKQKPIEGEWKLDKKGTLVKGWNAWLKKYQKLPAEEFMPPEDYEELKKLMLQFVNAPMYWSYLVEAYKKVPLARRLVLNEELGQTFLHLLASDSSKFEIAEQVLAYVDGVILRMKDKDGNTALHIAAATGFLLMCQVIVSRSSGLILDGNLKGETPLSILTSHRNLKGETPLSILTSRLLQCAAVGKWKEVMHKYTQIREALNVMTQIPHRTPLHMAVSLGNAGHARKVLQTVDEGELRISDEDGNVALHLAVGKGMRDLIQRMVQKCPQLVNLRNGKGETPLFLASWHGDADIYSYLQRHTYRNVITATTNKGDTALHCAISHEHFDIAYHMFHSSSSNYSEDLLCNRNKIGETPLSILINKPTAFKSGTRLEFMDRIIYSFIWVENPEKASYNPRKYGKQAIATCFMTFTKLSMLWLKMIFIYCFGKKGCLGDVESQQDVSEKPNRPKPFLRSKSKFPLHLSNFVVTCIATLKMFISFWICLLLPVERIRSIKRKHFLVREIMKRLIEIELQTESISDVTEGETRLLIAAKLGVTEVVKEILTRFPEAFNEKRMSDNRNAMLLAIQNRQANVVELLLDMRKKGIIKWEDAENEDNERNNALHLAAANSSHQPWGMPQTMKLHWEIKWYNYVRNSMPERFSKALNNAGKTPSETFEEEHKSLLQSKEHREWLNTTSQSCSVVAGLIATVAFASATTIPGGNNNAGIPNFQGHPAFDTFVVSAFVALCFSLVSLIMFLTILISPYQGFGDASKSLPEKLMVGLTSLLLSLGSMLVSFCAGHFFYLKGKMTFVAIPAYAIGCLFIFIILITQFPFYTNLVLYVTRRKPRPWYDQHSV